jgi:hypothetical protein
MFIALRLMRKNKKQKPQDMILRLSRKSIRKKEEYKFNYPINRVTKI